MARRAPAAPARAHRARRARRRITRDVAILTFALGLAGVDVLFLGARPSTLGFCTGLVLSPLVMRYEEARREDGRE